MFSPFIIVNNNESNNKGSCTGRLEKKKEVTEENFYLTDLD